MRLDVGSSILSLATLSIKLLVPACVSRTTCVPYSLTLNLKRIRPPSQYSEIARVAVASVPLFSR